MNNIEENNLEKTIEEVQGWRVVKVSDTSKHYQIKAWIHRYVKGNWSNRENCYFFERPTDATTFALRWT